MSFRASRNSICAPLNLAATRPDIDNEQLSVVDGAADPVVTSPDPVAPSADASWVDADPPWVTAKSPPDCVGARRSTASEDCAHQGDLAGLV